MKTKLALIFIFLHIWAYAGPAKSVNSTGTGDWTDPIWSQTPDESKDYITITAGDSIYYSGNLSYGGTLTVNGTLYITGNITLGGDLTIGTNGRLIVVGGSTHNSGDITVDGGYMKINGNFSVAGNMNLDVINGGFFEVHDFASSGSASITVDNESTVSVLGDMSNSGNGDIVVDGIVMVEGDLTSNGSGSMTGTGSLVVGGEIYDNNDGILDSLEYAKIYSLGTGSGTWGDIGNWSLDKTTSCGCLPTSNNRAFIQNTHTITLNDATTVNSLEVETGGTLIIDNGGTITTNNLNIITGTMTLKQGGSYIDLATTLYEANATAELTMSGNMYEYISPVFQNLASSNYSNYIFAYDETQADNWEDIDTENDFLGWVTPPSTLVPGAGYAVFNLSGTTYNLSGQFNTGDISVNITNTNAVGDNNYDGWNLIGNPYPSGISISDLTAINADFDGNIYLWDDDNSQGTDYTSSDYIQVNSAGSIVGGGNGSTITDNVIAPHQGFVVKATTNGTVTFTNGMRGTNAGTFVKKNNQIEDIQRFKINIKDSEQKLYNETLIAFTDVATKDLDRGFDGFKRKGNPNIALYSVHSLGDLGIQSLPSITEKTEISLGYTVKNAGSYTFSINENDTENTLVFLKDHENGRVISLNINSTYTFNSESGEYKNRFLLIFKPQTEINEDITEKEPFSHVYTSNTKIFIQNLLEEPLKGTVNIYNPMGGRIAQHAINVDMEYSITPPSSTGHYIHVEIITFEGKRAVKTVFFP